MIKTNSAKQAVEIAKDFLELSGIPFSVITKSMSQDGKWIVEANTLGAKYRLEIDKESGEVIEYNQI